MAKNRKYQHYFTLRGTGKKYLRFAIPVRPAEEPEQFQRLRKHVMRGIEGQACTCANAEGALDGLGGYAWEFSATRAFKIDKVDKRGVPAGGIFYMHNQNGFQEKYDRLGKRAMLASSECEGTVVLNPPPRTKLPIRRARYQSGFPKRAKRRKGGIGRMLRAELIAPPKENFLTAAKGEVSRET